MKTIRWLAGVVFVAALTGCEQKMAEQPVYEPFEASRLFPDGSSAQRPVPGTVARGVDMRFDDLQVRSAEPPTRDDELDASANETSENSPGGFSDEFPVQVNTALMRRGREQFGIYCAPCHGVAGYGDGPVVQHGFPPARSLHLEEVRDHPAGYLFHVITTGPGKMPSYAGRIDPEDRWSIVAFVRALQFSQYARLDDLPEPIQQSARAAITSDNQ